MLDDIIKRVLKEATGDSTGSRGSYVLPLQPGIRQFSDSQNGPFTIQVSKYDSPDLEYDSYDGSMQTPKNQIKKIEKKAEKVTNYIKTHPYATFSDDDGNNINQTPGKNLSIVPIKEDITEDLAVWFGTKKKPKGSKQPKGPWVNICRKVDGKHPPCGRSNTDKGGYPKCRAAGVAGKMSDSEKRAACQQKRKAEKKDTQTGKGQKPIMTSYKPKKKTNEDMKKILRLTESDINRLVKKVLKEENEEFLNLQDKVDHKKFDFRRERNETSKVRPLYNVDPSIKNVQKFQDLVYGYNNRNERIVKVRKDSKFGKNEGLNDLVILYNCNNDTLNYANIDRPIIQQQNLDEAWLKTWCGKITWSSRIRY